MYAEENPLLSDNGEEEDIFVKSERKVDGKADDPILDTIGEFGPYQLYICGVGFLLTVVHSWLSLSLKFVGLSPRFHCDEGDSPEDVETAGACLAHFGNITKPCTRFTYERQDVYNTITERWDLVCSSSGLPNVAQSIFFGGCLVGALLAGLAADRWGRKRVTVFLVIVFSFSGVAGALVNNWNVWLSLRFLIGAATIGMITARFSLQSELMGSSWRSYASMLSGSGWVVGYMSLPLLAVNVGDMRGLEFLLGISAIPFSVLIAWGHPESPKWLITVGQHEEAARICNNIAVWNQRAVDEITGKSLKHMNDPKSKASSVSEASLASIRHYPCLAKNLMALSLAWFAIGMSYFGLALHTPEFGSSVFVIFFLGGLMDLPVILAGPPLLNMIGRKIVMTVSLLTAAICLLVTPAVPRNVFPSEWPVVLLAIVGKMGAGMGFDTGYVWTPEIFPTVVRSSALATCSASARLGAILAPLVSNMAEESDEFPLIIFGLVALVAGLVSLQIQPETRSVGCLPDTMEEGERRCKNLTKVTNL